ncbi:MAG: UPF0182 family protein [Candidatus Spechtbacterales bacterium]
MIVFVVYILFALPFGLNLYRNLLKKPGFGGEFTSSKKWKRSIVLWIAGWLSLSLILWASSVYLDVLWFSELGQENRFFTVFKTKFTLAAISGFAALTSTLALGIWTRSLIAKTHKLSNEKQNVIAQMTIVVSIFLGFIFSITVAGQWETVLLFLNAEPFGVTDPIFGKDVGFYVFALPFLEAIGNSVLWILILQIFFVLALVYTTMPYDQKSYGIVENVFKGYVLKTMSPLFFTMFGLFAAVFAYKRYLVPYNYLFDDNGAFSGVNYVDAVHRIGLNKILVAVLSLSSIVFFVAPFLFRTTKKKIIALFAPSSVAFAFMLALLIVPTFVQNITVKPNELELERQYIEWNIKFTQIAYNLDKITVENYDPALDTERDGSSSKSLDPNDVLNEVETLKNIRIADERALINFFRQSQEFRRYYEFSDVYESRYYINGEYRQIIIAVRELNQNLLDAAAKTWVNLRLKFTHGYGVVMIPVNEFEGGLPVLFMHDVPVKSSVDDLEVVRAEVYFGMRTNSFVIINTEEDEFSYQVGQTVVNSRYSGKAGIELGDKFSLRRLIVAYHTDGVNLYTSDSIHADSRIILHRNVMDRVKKLAPFLKYEDDPYLVVTEEGRLMWMLDAYTTTNKFPYSASKSGMNYIRNSVKVTIDAYDGTVNFYAFDNSDPILKAWRNIFPDLFKDKEDMPAGILAHVRYPKKMLLTQAEIYSVYHMENVETFYKREDVYDFATEKYSRESTINTSMGGVLTSVSEATVYVRPYYVLMKLPGKDEQEFVLGVPFTPKGQMGRERLQLIAWMAARSDGDNYGDIVIYRLPSHRLIPGPQQVESYVDSDAEMSAQMTLWDQRGSSVIRGNMITIPIAGTVLNVEPIYIESNNSPIPRLQKVIVSIGEYVAWGDTLDEALDALFSKMDSSHVSLPDLPAGTDQSVVATILIQRAIDHFESYLAYQAEGKMIDAARELEKHHEILRQIKKLFSQESSEID